MKGRPRTVRAAIESYLARPISPAELARHAECKRQYAATMLCRAVSEGWAKRLKRGVYVSAEFKPQPTALNWTRR